jgi:predicted TIM-barrel fold metal-dependent hydrolase
MLGDYAAVKSQRYRPDDFSRETRFHNVQKVIHVQAASGLEDPVQETRWLQGFADRTSIPHGIIAYADLASPNVAVTLERHAKFANFRGVRDLREDDYLTNPSWQRGYSMLEEYGLVCCDAPLIDAVQDAVQVIGQVPGVIYCVDHAGLPRRRDREYFEAWRHKMRKLAALENTVVKISGLAMGDHAWSVESLRPWILECIDAWGVDRAIFGSNWPVERLYSSYGDVVDAYRKIVTVFTIEEQEKLLIGNAIRIFRLSP